jgi:single-strand DNA-binding protein
MQHNRIEISGFLSDRPTLRYLPSGTKVANARLGETCRFAGSDGQLQSHTNWHSLVFYNNLADLAITYERGENIFVVGTVQQRKFTPADGSPRIVHEVLVRSCHRIAASKTGEPESAEAPTNDRDAGRSGVENDDDTWPVAAR